MHKIRQFDGINLIPATPQRINKVSSPTSVGLNLAPDTPLQHTHTHTHTLLPLTPESRLQRLTWNTQTPVAVAHAATHAVGARVQGTEVHQLGARGAGEAGSAAAAEAQGPGALSVARAVVVTGARGARVHLLLAGSALVAWTRHTDGGRADQGIYC